MLRGVYGLPRAVDTRNVYVLALVEIKLELMKPDGRTMREHVQGIVEAQEQLHNAAATRRETSRSRECVEMSRGEPPHFTVGEILSWWRGSGKSGKHAKFVSEWTHSWRVVSEDREDLYKVEHISIGGSVGHQCDSNAALRR